MVTLKCCWYHLERGLCGGSAGSALRDTARFEETFVTVFCDCGGQSGHGCRTRHGSIHVSRTGRVCVFSAAAAQGDMAPPLNAGRTWISPHARSGAWLFSGIILGFVLGYSDLLSSFQLASALRSTTVAQELLVDAPRSDVEEVLLENATFDALRQQKPPLETPSLPEPQGLPIGSPRDASPQQKPLVAVKTRALTELQEVALKVAARDPLRQQELVVAVTTAGPVLTQASEFISHMRRIGIASQLLLIALDTELVAPGGFCDIENVTCVYRERTAYEWASRRRGNEG